MIVILIKSVYLLSVELHAFFWKCSFGHLVNMLFDKFVYIAVLGTLTPPDYDETCFSAFNNASGSSAARHAVTGPFSEFYNIFVMWDFNRSQNYNNQLGANFTKFDY